MNARPKKTNVVALPTSFVGRDDDLALLHGELRRGRLVTVVGPPGAGKTRLAQEYVLRHGGAFVGSAAGGAWFCDLAEASTVDDVLGTVAAALGVSLADPRARPDPAGHLESVLLSRGATLLVLDNFEQLVSVATPIVARWLRAAPELTVIVTSRARLGLAGENCFELGGLELGEGSDASEAARLFLERARAARRDFEPTPDEQRSIARLCERLDGLPLAIELAGARMGVFGPKQLLDRLSKSLDVLRGGAGRATTLRVTLDWSWKLLSAAERAVLAQISVFHGGFSLEAAEAVVDVPKSGETHETVDLLEALRNSSLLRSWAQEELPGEVRFGLLEVVRAYAEEKLEQSGLGEATRRRHAEYFRRAGEEWASQVERRNGPEFLRRLALELPNLTAVHRRALSAPTPGPDDIALALSAALALEHVFYMRGPTAPCLAMLDEAFGHDVAGVDPRLCALGEKARGRALRDLGKSEESAAALERALAIARRLGDRSLEGRVLGHVGFGLQAQGRLEEALGAYTEGRAAVSAAGDRRSEGMLLAAVATALAALGRGDEAARAYDEALAIDDEVGNRYAAAAALASRAELSRAKGRPESARADLERALEVYAEFGERRHEGIALYDLGILHQERGDFQQARWLLERALVRHREFGGRSFLSGALYALAGLEREQGHLADARRLTEQAARVARALADRPALVRALAQLGATLAALGRIAPAREALDEASKLAGALGDPALSRLVAIEAGHTDLADQPAAVRARLASVIEGTPLAARAAPERLAIRLLSRALEDTPPPASVEHTPTAVDGPTPLGRYELLLEVAAGGMATVFVGRQRGAGGFERLVAIKRLHPHLASQTSFSRAFLDEARVAALVRHPNVVSVQDVYQEGGERLLVMDYVDGQSLADVLSAAARTASAIPRATGLYVLSQALRGLHAVHEQKRLDGTPLGIVHRDLSPHNVLLGADGSVRITDFGIAKSEGQPAPGELGVARGKLRYMAPEQARGASLDRRADLFSAGVVAWELLSGARLFDTASDAEVMAALMDPSFRPPPLDAPKQLVEIVERALAFDPAMRFTSALEMSLAVEHVALAAGEIAREPDVARLVEELAGAALAERRHALSAALASGRNLETPSVAPHAGTPSPSEQPRILRAGASGRWFVPPGGEHVSLERRRALRRVLKALVDQRISAPGKALTQEELLAAGWPGEKVRHDAGMLRVYNALSTLRKLGLREVLCSRDDGYLIDAKVAVEREDEPGAD